MIVEDLKHTEDIDIKNERSRLYHVEVIELYHKMNNQSIY